MDLPSRQEIRNGLKEVAESAGFSGSSVDFILSVMSTGYYETLLRSIGVVRESNPETAAGINSLLTLAASRMYHAFRGTCPILILRGKSSKKQTLKRGTKIWSGTEFNLYVKEDITLESNKLSEIILVASKRYIESSKRNKSDRYYVEFLLNDLSEDIKLYIQPDQTEFINNNIGTLITPTYNFREHVSDNTSEYNIFDVTIADFGVRYYMKTPNDYNFSISAFLYSSDINDLVSELEENSMSDIFEYAQNNNTDPYRYSSPDLLDLKVSIDKFEAYTIEFRTRALPRESKEELKVNYNSQVESIYLIRSNSDLLNSFRLAFGFKVSDVNLKLIETWNPSEVPGEEYDWLPSYPESSSIPMVVFFYIPKDLSNLISISEFNRYIEEVKYYYLFDNLVACRGESLKLDVNITLKSSDSVDTQNKVQDLMQSYLDKFNQGISEKRLRTQLSKISSVEEVSDIVIKVNDSTLSEDFEGNEYSYFSSDPDYFNLNLDIIID